MFHAYKIARLLTITSIADMNNAVALCPTCHRSFDDHNSPGFVFLPADIAYFRRHEERDAQRRRETHRMTGADVERTVPNGAAYLQHHIQMGVVDQDAIGGMYERYVLRDWLPSIYQNRFGQVMPPACWHGDPMAAFRRAFAILSSPAPSGVPWPKMKEISDLCALYRETDATYRDNGPQRDQVSKDERPSSHDSEEPQHPEKSSRPGQEAPSRLRGGTATGSPGQSYSSQPQPSASFGNERSTLEQSSSAVSDGKTYCSLRPEHGEPSETTRRARRKVLDWLDLESTLSEVTYGPDSADPTLWSPSDGERELEGSEENPAAEDGARMPERGWKWGITGSTANYIIEFYTDIQESALEEFRRRQGGV